MAIKVIPISEVRKHISAIIDEIGDTDKTYCIVKNSRAVAMIVSIGYFNSLLEKLEELGEDTKIKFDSKK